MTERWVVDASVVTKFYLKDEDHSQFAQALLDDFGDGSVELIAPQVLLYEVSGSILRAVRQRRLDKAKADNALTQFFRLGIHLVGDEETLPSMIGEAYATASRVNCGLYDALYLAVAEVFHLSLVTSDARFYRALSSQRVDSVVWIADYESPVLS